MLSTMPPTTSLLAHLIRPSVSYDVSIYHSDTWRDSLSPICPPPPSPSITSLPYQLKRYISLHESVPKTSTVIDVVSSNLKMQLMFEYSTYFSDPLLG